MKRCKYFKAYQGLYKPRCGCDSYWNKFIRTRVAIVRAKLDIKTNKLYESCVELRERQEAEATMYRHHPCNSGDHVYILSSFGRKCIRCGINEEDS